MTRFHIYGTSVELADATAHFILEQAQQAIHSRGSFSMALAGGSTPTATYQSLAKIIDTSQVEPTDLEIFWGDERCVPPDDPNSNFRMAQETLLTPLAIPATQVHPVRCEADPKQAAANYEDELRQNFDGKDRRFDVVLLGLGANSHTASLFPGSDLLEQQDRWAAAEFVKEVGGWRVTLTPPAINMARIVIFLVQGQEKAEAVQHIVEGDHDPRRWPAQIVEPVEGELHWFLDEASARLL